MPNPDQLTLSPEEMRELGYRVIDMLVDHFSSLPEKPVTRKSTRSELQTKLLEDLPQKGVDPHQLLDKLDQEIFRNIMHLDHPRFFAFVPSPSNYLSALADALASGYNIFAGTWLEASGPAMIELITIDWLRQTCGLPESAGGLFVSGGSMANLTALTVARHIKLGFHDPKAIIYCSDQTHSSIKRGLQVMGFLPAQLRTLPTDDQFKLDLAALHQAVQADRQAGCLPFCVVANAGTTSTGAIDPFAQLAEICRKFDLWLHIDGAYGAAAALSSSGRQVLDGMEYADSLSIDPHKWLFQPYEIGCVLVRDESWLKETFHILPEYLADIEEQRGEVNFCDRGIQLTRGFRALKFWFSMKSFGREGFESAINMGLELAKFAGHIIDQLPNWSIVTPPQLGVITFRYAPININLETQNQINDALPNAFIEDGFAMISTTTLRNMTVLRMCTINPRTTKEDIQKTLFKLANFAEKWSS